MNKVFSTSLKTEGAHRSKRPAHTERRRECWVCEWYSLKQQQNLAQTAMKSISPFDEWNIYESNFFVFYLHRRHISFVLLVAVCVRLRFMVQSLNFPLSLSHSLACLQWLQKLPLQNSRSCNSKAMKQHKNTQHNLIKRCAAWRKRKKWEQKILTERDRRIKKFELCDWELGNKHIELINNNHQTKTYGKPNQLENQIY